MNSFLGSQIAFEVILFCGKRYKKYTLFRFIKLVGAPSGYINGKCRQSGYFEVPHIRAYFLFLQHSGFKLLMYCVPIKGLAYGIR
jgi:hypothetical protein